MGGTPACPDGAHRVVEGFCSAVRAVRAELEQPVIELSRDTGSNLVIRPPLRANDVPEARDLERCRQMVGLISHVHGRLGGRAGR